MDRSGGVEDLEIRHAFESGAAGAPGACTALQRATPCARWWKALTPVDAIAVLQRDRAGQDRGAQMVARGELDGADPALQQVVRSGGRALQRCGADRVHAVGLDGFKEAVDAMEHQRGGVRRWWLASSCGTPLRCKMAWPEYGDPASWSEEPVHGGWRHGMARRWAGSVETEADGRQMRSRSSGEREDRHGQLLPRAWSSGAGGQGCRDSSIRVSFTRRGWQAWRRGRGVG